MTKLILKVLFQTILTDGLTYEVYGRITDISLKTLVKSEQV